MRRRPEHDVLFEPLEIGSKTFRNRFYSVPHALFKPGRRMSEIGFRRMKAEGGWAAVCGGIISIRPDGWGGNPPRIWDEVDRDILTRVATEVHTQGALAGIELGHPGALTEGEKFSPPIGASHVANPDLSHVVPKALTLDEISALQHDWVGAGQIAAEIGYDIVYLYGAHGFMPAQFLSSFFNKRTDAYGGSLENRARFWLESLERLKNLLAGRSLIAVRIAAEAFSPFGVSAEETLDFIRLADDLVDLWDVNVGFHWAPDSAPSSVMSEGYQVEWSGQVRRATAKPIVGVARLTNPDRMAEILRSGVWDFIGGARPGIADPFLPRKIEDGRYSDIRECTGANFCIAVETKTAGLSCLQNPTIGEEYRRGWHPERYEPARDSALDVLVLGAGPAGMECARVLGARGFRRVHLVDAQRDPGGHLNWLTRLPGMGEWARVTNYRAIQLQQLANVEMVPETRLSASDVLDYGADLVVVATGSHWIGSDADWHYVPLSQIAASGIEILTPEAILVEGLRPRGQTVTVWDGDGSAVAIGLAQLLASEGLEVTFASHFDAIAPLLDLSFEGAGARTRAHDLGVSLYRGMTPVRAAPGELVCRGEFDVESSLPTDTLVLVAQRIAYDELHIELQARSDEWPDAGIRDVFPIGDCVAPRHLGYVIADGHRLGREIDSATPHQPLLPRNEYDGDGLTAVFERV